MGVFKIAFSLNVSACRLVSSMPLITNERCQESQLKSPSVGCVSCDSEGQFCLDLSIFLQVNGTESFNNLIWIISSEKHPT